MHQRKDDHTQNFISEVRSLMAKQQEFSEYVEKCAGAGGLLDGRVSEVFAETVSGLAKVVLTGIRFSSFGSVNRGRR